MSEKKIPLQLRKLIVEVLSVAQKAYEKKSSSKSLKCLKQVSEVLQKKNSRKRLLSSVEDLELIESFFLKLKPDEQFEVAHAMSLNLELINCCESAYRTYRLKQKSELNTFSKKSIERLVFVLTAHPTEAKSQESLLNFKIIRELLLRKLEGQTFSELEEALFHRVCLAWELPLAKRRKPSVVDEAEMISSLLLQPELLEVLFESRNEKLKTYIRTWVGGDKDGHPGIDEKVMTQCLGVSRRRILSLIKDKGKSVLNDLQLLPEKCGKELVSDFKTLLQFKELVNLKSRDGLRVEEFQKKIIDFKSQYETTVGSSSHELNFIFDLMQLFPGLVLPIEVREDSEVVHKAVLEKENLAITKMIKCLSELSEGSSIKNYVRGFVLSMTESEKDIEAGMSLVQKMTGQLSLPVVPLFETEKALIESVEILERFFDKGSRTRKLQKLWGGKFEVMLGYSDSAKQSGSIASRRMIQNSLYRLERVIQKAGFVPIFFHGSGGSVARGGGSIEEQIAWWPESAVTNFKATIQGEMIQRTFSSPEILASQIGKIAGPKRIGKAQLKAGRLSAEEIKQLDLFQERVKLKYQEKVKSEQFLEVVEKATPYSYLQYLKIGSRPSKRSAQLNLKSLRAIPWVLCWTQTRVLFPVWWGVGATWEEMSGKEKARLVNVYKKDQFLSSFVKLLGFSLFKVDMGVWKFYLKKSQLSSELQQHVFKEFETEYKKACRFVKELTGEKSLLWYRPWLEESILVRSPLINPLNVFQILAFANKDMNLLQETTTGIASGMLTTG